MIPACKTPFFKTFILTGLIVLMIGLSAAAVDDETASPMELKAKEAWASLRTDFPQVQRYIEEGRITRLYGAAFANGGSPEMAAESFIGQHIELFGINSSDLKAQSLLIDKRHVQPMMYNQTTGQYKFTLVYYTQYYNDIPVYNADLRLLVKNSQDYPLVLASSALRKLDNFSMADKSGYDNSIATMMIQSDNPDLDSFSEPELVVWAGAKIKSETPRPAFKIIGTSDFPSEWLYIIDAENGNILYKEDLIIFEDVTGSVHGMGTPGYAADICAPDVEMTMPYARVEIGSTIEYTDIDGNFIIPNGGTDQVTVESLMRGLYFQIFNYLGSVEDMTMPVTPPGPADFLHNASSTEYVRSQVNAYIMSNQVRDMTLKFNPSYPEVSIETSFPVYVNRTDGYCPGNAWYSPSEQSLNFCASGSGYPNTAFQSVVFHEYGHHLVNVGGSGQGQYGEGMGDVVAMVWSDDSRLGVGFTGNCSNGIRNADNTMQYPCSDEIHTCGQLISGCVWDIRNELISIYPSSYLDTLANWSINSILLHSGTEITPQIAIDFLTLDDDDANLENGTPHYDQICAGFNAHNMTCPEVSSIWFDYPAGKPEISDPSGTTTFNVIVQPGAVAPVTGSAVFYYTLDGVIFETGDVTELTPHVYEVTMPAASCNTRIQWYLSAEDLDGGFITEPKDAPTELNSTVAASESYIIFEDDFETDKGWTVSGSVGDGPWERGIPIGGGDRGDPPTDYDGSGYCYLTDNVDDNSDVDDGTTILTSPQFDLTKGDARIHYARWYSNDFGSDPFNDEMYVYISNNDGSNWTLVETIGPVNQASGGWYTFDFFVADIIVPTPFMRLRFDVSDLNSGSVVEAGIDDVVITSYRCTNQPIIQTSDLPDWTVDYAYSIQLDANGGLGELTWSDRDSDLIGTGLSLGSDGLLSGTPTAAGLISFTAMVEDTALNFDEKLFSFDINDHVQIATITLPDWTVGQAYSQVLAATEGTTPYAWTDKNGDLVPTGLTLDSDGNLTGAPGSDGVVSFTAMVTDNVGDEAEQVLSFTVNPAVLVTTTTVPDGQLESEYSHQLESTGGTSPIIWYDKNGDLPNIGLAMNPQGVIIGTPTDTGSVLFVAEANDNTGSSDEAVLTLHVGPAYLCGDANGDDEVNIVDISFIIDYLYLDGPPPVPLEAADVNADGEVNIIDITVMIAFLYDSGPNLICL